ncbi:uncharacterized protein VP01_8577g1, partial [Puccinia sorghi]
TWRNIHNIANKFVEEDQNFPYGPCQMEQVRDFAASGKSFHSFSLSLSLQLKNETLKNALVYLIAASNLPFSFVEQKMLNEFGKLLTMDAMPWMNNMLHSGLNKYVAKQAKLLFTQDSWTAPNCFSFMVEMAHFIHNEFFMRHMTLGVPQVQFISFSFQEATLFMD